MLSAIVAKYPIILKPTTKIMEKWSATLRSAHIFKNFFVKLVSLDKNMAPGLSANHMMPLNQKM